MKKEFPDLKGFSKRNIKYMKQWYLFWTTEDAIVQQLVAQIPWGHNIVILAKTKNKSEALFYVRKTIERDIEKPIGVSEYKLNQLLPDKYRKSLPTIEEIEAELES